MPKLGVDELQAILGEGFPAADVPHVEEVTDDYVIVSYSVNDRHGRPGGTLAGPVMMSLADTSAWIAIMSQIGPVVLAVTTSLHIDFLRKPHLSSRSPARRPPWGRLAACDRDRRFQRP